MNSRERVLTVFGHELPDRVPCWCGASVEFWEKAKEELNLDDEELRLRFKDDFRRVFAEYSGPKFALEHPQATYRTPFGIEREGYGYGQPLTHPLFDRFMTPHLKRLCDLGHSYGLKTHMHCCGGVYELIPSMIDAGIDSLHAVQPSCRGMELARLKSDFGDKMVFNGGIDSHHTLMEKDAAGVKEDTRQVLETMMPGGGYIAGASHDTILEEISVENVLAMFDAIHEYGMYS